MNWKFWKKNKEQKKEAEVVEKDVMENNLVLIIEMSPNGDIYSDAFFPLLNDEDSKVAANNFAVLLSLLNNGTLLPTLQKAVVKGGVNSNNSIMAHLVLDKLNGFIEKGFNKVTGDDLVVKPTDVFRMGMN